MTKLIKAAAAALSIAMLAVTLQPGQSAAMEEVELVVGTADVDSPLFAAGNGISAASVLGAKGVKVYNYSTKGDKDNLSRIVKSRRAINLALVSAKGLAGASEKQKNGISGLMSIGSIKGDRILLIARNATPKGVSEDDYARALSSVIAALKGGKGMKLVKGQWSSFAPDSGEAAFRSAGVKMHKASMM